MSREAVYALSVILLISLVTWGCSSDDEEADDGGPVFTPGDYNSNNDGDVDDDSSSEPLSDCRLICNNYCNALKTCVNNLDMEEFATCKDDCRNIQTNQSWPKWVSCGEKADSCVPFLACRDKGGDSSWQCDPGEPLLDGDVDQDSDLPVDGDGEDVEQEMDDPLPTCIHDYDCADDERCDTITHHCAKSCDPFAPVCPEGQLCRILTIGEMAGKGAGVCALEPGTGKLEGEVCNSYTPCRVDLVCDSTERCSKVCDDANGDDDCDSGLRCIDYPTSGTGVCRFCNTNFPCDYPAECVSGYCREGEVCASFDDCAHPDTCFMGYCEDGCWNSGCQQGECDQTTGYCTTDYCPDGCGANECCNRSTCGPCCSEDCGSGTTCAYDPACAPDSNYCCVQRPDCRAKANGWCDPYPCNEYTGECIGLCPEFCPFGMHCDETTFYKCKPDATESCEYNPMIDDCLEVNPCMKCDSAGFPPTNGKCVGTTACAGTFCLDRGVPCTTLGGTFLGCCSGMQCLTSTGGGQVCCPPEAFDPIKGCQDEEATKPPIDCSECEALEGNYCLPASPGSCMQGSADLHDKLRFEKYYGDDSCYMQVFAGSSLLVGFLGCDSQLIELYDHSGNECALFWDKVNEEFIYNCVGSSSCQLHLTQANCSK